MASSVECSQRMSGSEGAKRIEKEGVPVAVVDVDGNDGWWDEWGVNGDYFWQGILELLDGCDICHMTMIIKWWMEVDWIR